MTTVSLHFLSQLEGIVWCCLCYDCILLYKASAKRLSWNCSVITEIFVVACSFWNSIKACIRYLVCMLISFEWIPSCIKAAYFHYSLPKTGSLVSLTERCFLSWLICQQCLCLFMGKCFFWTLVILKKSKPTIQRPRGSGLAKNGTRRELVKQNRKYVVRRYSYCWALSWSVGFVLQNGISDRAGC